MTAATVVAKLDVAAGKRLYAALGREAFAFRPVDHAHWSARGPDVVVTWYRSGKLVVQGRGADTFRDRFLAGVERAEPAKRSPGPGRLRGPTIGSDESGKGDYFGPLVVAAAFARPEDLPALDAMGVMDSKAATDAHIRRVEGALATLLPHAVVVLEPEDYNRTYAGIRNLNVLLGRLHAKVLDEALEVL
ncbi:MAG: DUF3378 domain-containing protein, partial [Planctomycetota bacterium]